MSSAALEEISTAGLFLVAIGILCVGFFYPKLKGIGRFDAPEAPLFRQMLAPLSKILKRLECERWEWAPFAWYLGWIFLLLGSILQLLPRFFR